MGRNSAVDIVKGVGIVLVVLGHAMSPLKSFVYLFHMAIFFIASGYCFSDKYSCSVTSYADLFKKRLGSLYIPFVAFNLLYLALTNVFIDVGVYTDNPLFLNDPLASQWGLKESISLQQFIRSGLSVLSFASAQQLAGASWFLVVLFFLTMAYGLIELCARKIRFNVTCIHFILSCVFLMSGYFLSQNNIRLSRGMDVVLSVYILFFFGRLFKSTLHNATQRYTTLLDARLGKVIYLSSVFVLASFILMFMSRLGNVELAQNKYPGPIFFILASLSGWFLVFSFSKLIEEGFMGKVLAYLGRKTIPILFLHFLSFKLVTAILIMLNHEPWYKLASFPVLYDGEFWVLYTMVGVGLPVLIDFLYRKSLSAMCILYKQCLCDYSG